ncbi:MAG: tRNA (adenosine(37)-N6)-threonylcarbamoyltransferase complex dimerization subunit type 1 TsaB [Bacteroidota bacterium]|nr:tRNA (adenosine(37)-N6)-threonylcarbamoyltransferase complex dimerization subunit type 1 TsaB [Bacteroidota bacterium]
MNTHILILETTADICSAAICRDGELVSYTFEDGKKHSSVITLLIEKVCQEAHILLKDIQAVALNMGPGSYTGLRVGLSAAKGICYANEIPLITVNGFEILYHLFAKQQSEVNSLLIPCIHARKDEFFFTVLDKDGNVVESPSYLLAKDLVDYAQTNFEGFIFCGEDRDLFTKFATQNDNFKYIQTEKINANHLAQIVHQKYIKNTFADLAYSEPLYIKEFQTY